MDASSSYVTDESPWGDIDSAPWPGPGAPVDRQSMGFVEDPFFTHGWADGSIFRGFKEADAEAARRRRKIKVAKGSNYFARARHWREVQEGRAFIPPNAFYELLRKNKLTADDAERQSRIDRAARMFLMHAQGALRAHYFAWMETAKKSIRAKKFLIRQMYGMQRSCLTEWYEYTMKMKKAKKLMARHMVGASTKAFIAWKEYVVKNNKVKAFLKHLMGKLEETTFRKWRDHVKVKKFLMLKMAKLLQGAKREKFSRWFKFSSTNAKIKRLVAKHFVGCVRLCLTSWFGYVGKMIKCKRIFAKGLVGLQKMVFVAWRGVTDEWGRERKERELWQGHRKPDDFFSLDDWSAPQHTVKPFARHHVGVLVKWRVY